MPSRHTRLSRFLSYVLRHRPDAIGLSLDRGGWALVEELLAKAEKHGKAISREFLHEVVEMNDKRRFRLSADGQRIRASQGHSIEVDLGLEPIEPPETLYHGTAERFLDSILETGLEPRGRQHVHLSSDVETARKVGARHGRPVILEVRAGELARAGQAFYLSDNAVWLTERVPVEGLVADACRALFRGERNTAGQP